jgi:hypothetical protein
MEPTEKAALLGVENDLESYHYINKENIVRRLRKDGKKVFLDSGAFSAFSLGATIDIEKYCAYIRKNHDIIEVASVLDGIGDPLLTWQNQKRMEQLGTNPLPCFHYGEDERYLDWYVENYEYITLGGMVPISTPQLRLWLDRIWKDHLTDDQGRPKLRVHGFGLTTISLMKRYPWYSVDSSSWVQQAANGSILLPWHWKALSVSNNSPSAKKDNQHLNTLPEDQKQAVIKIIEDLGFDIDRMQNNYIARWTFNLMSFTLLGAELTKIKSPVYVEDQMGLF